ncbi:MAG: hypothetical protein ACRC1R_05140 [Cetobacterium sp.]|uniref:hypothetical protein n=1 Tax=Cetobacterium sp. TaxID=2071632 RepID=UPI003F39BF9A
MFGKMNLTQKSYENTSPIAKPGDFYLKEAGAKIPAKSICGIKYDDGKIYPYNSEASDGTEIPRYFSEEEVLINTKSSFMRNGSLWEDRIEITAKAKEQLIDIGFKFIKPNKQY